MKKKEAAIEIVKKFIQNDPLKAAQALETLAVSDAAQVLKDLSSALAAQCLEHLPPLTSAQLLEKNSKEEAADILLKVGKYHAADIFRRFNPAFSQHWCNSRGLEPPFDNGQPTAGSCEQPRSRLRASNGEME